MGYDMTARCASAATRDALLAFLAERWPAAERFWPSTEVADAGGWGWTTRHPSLGLHVSPMARAADWDLMAWLAVRTGWVGKTGNPAIWWDDEPMWLIAADTPKASTTRHTVVNAEGRIVGNDPDQSPVFAERLYDPTGSERDARRGLLDQWAAEWSQLAPVVPRRPHP